MKTMALADVENGSMKIEFLSFLAAVEVCMQHASISADCHGGLVIFGLAPGAFDGFRVTLTGTGFADVATSFNDFGVKFQEDLTGGGYAFYSNGGTQAVPEPASIALLGSGLAFLSVRMRRKKA